MIRTIADSIQFGAAVARGGGKQPFACQNSCSQALPELRESEIAQRSAKLPI
ncbi:MAG: hypothetical protein ACKO2K_15735 [Alphaproteobacteria bacterium]